MKLPGYFIFESRPVKVVATDDGGMTVLKYDWDSGEFEYGMEYLSELFRGGADVVEVTEEQFDSYVEELRSRAGHGPPAVHGTGGEVPPVYGAFHCLTCQRVYYYRGLLPDFTEYSAFRCPECNHVMREVIPDSFLDSTAETLSLLAELDDALGRD